MQELMNTVGDGRVRRAMEHDRELRVMLRGRKIDHLRETHVHASGFPGGKDGESLTDVRMEPRRVGVSER